MFDLSGKRALVTGASGGIGSAIAKALASQGAEVALSGTRVGALEDVAKDIIGKTHILPCNLSDMDSVERLVPQAEEAMGGIDILINNAGMTRDNIFMRMKDEEWDDVLKINLIISITSVVGVVGNPGQGNYAASKAGLAGMSKSLAYEVASRGITVNTIAPGFIASAMTDELNEKQHEAILQKVPAGRLGTAEEIAASAVFLSSEGAAYITGHTLNVNGGMVMI